MDEKKLILEFLQKERIEARSLQYNYNKDVGDVRVIIINQKREFFWRIAALALGLSGGLTFFYEETNYKHYFYLSLIFFVLVVMFAIFWTREVLDNDANDIQKQQDKYNIAIDEKISLIDKFAGEKLDSILYSDFLKDYFEESKKLPSIPLLIVEVKKVDEDRKNRNKKPLDYSGECIVFLFMCGLMFLVLSLIKFWLSWYFSLSFILLIFSFSFSDNFLKIIKKFSKLAHFLNKKNI